jgi:hypothetical protein
MRWVGLVALGVLLSASFGASTDCPASTTLIDSFDVGGELWIACEDLQKADGALVLLPPTGSTTEPQWFPKGYSMYGSSHDEDPSYYLGLGKKNVSNAAADILGIKMLTLPELTWNLVADAVRPSPPPSCITTAFSPLFIALTVFLGATDQRRRCSGFRGLPQFVGRHHV